MARVKKSRANPPAKAKHPRVWIVGCGPGSPDYLTEAARQAVAQAEVLVGSRRLLQLFASHAGKRISIDGCVTAAPARIAALVRGGKLVAVLVTGDPGLFSLAAGVVDAIGQKHCQIVPGVSAVQVAFARLALDWSGARVLSAHGRTPDVAAAELSRVEKIAVLAGGRAAIGWAAALAGGLRGSHAVWLCEDLTLPTERIRRTTPRSLARTRASPLAIVLLVRISV